MDDERIRLDGVSIRFRMSYHKVDTLPKMLSQWGAQLARSWQPEFFTALNDVSIAVRTGEIVGVIGRNGSGKSTLLRTISGIYHPDAGRVDVRGRVSALLQLGTGFNVTLNGRDNIILGGLTLGLSRQQIEDRMDMIADFAELGRFIDVPMRYYSSGMMSRLSFAMVLSIEPDILLIDETLSVGDVGFQAKSKAAMRDLLRKASCQMIVSHDLATIETLCTRAILVEAGRIVADGTPRDVLDRYSELLETSVSEKTSLQGIKEISAG
ncbi:ABC transporter ATP-binding protein [Caenimonas sedimenti]|uniref:ABC transporter ATP-binding protein n=1 Tax=Caenimonas sedimenti TaxID=2596921 RepID=A0A562ZU16_9BURK|nr:ABC transporter ATP-binding protein [Caenimonas sedimenti]TWO72100.1 ABC transporter ATP-binding protein [Caenimonas sedimenti]